MCRETYRETHRQKNVFTIFLGECVILVKLIVNRYFRAYQVTIKKALVWKRYGTRHPKSAVEGHVCYLWACYVAIGLGGA